MRSVEAVVLTYIIARTGLGLVALLRAERKDVLEIVRELGHWWHRWSWHREDRSHVTQPDQ